MRRCVGCGRTAPKGELVRLASVAGGAGNPMTVIVDARGTLPGRGAYLCREPGGRLRGECLALAGRRKALPRAFRRAVDLSDELVESVSR
ncbi:MAG: YlxR family protein [Solirubrobacteraceae bacterium]